MYRNMYRTLSTPVSCTLLALFTLSVNPAQGADWTAQQQEVVDAIEDYLDAWNRFDASALAAQCRDDCDRIDARGNVHSGREAILRHYARIFDNPPPDGVERSLSYEIASVRFATDDVAIVDARYTLESPPPFPYDTIEGFNTVVLVKGDAGWQRVAHRNWVPVTRPPRR